MTVSTTDAPAGELFGAGGDGPGQAPGETPPGAGETDGNGSERGRRAPGERVRSSSRDDDAPGDSDSDTDGDGDRGRQRRDEGTDGDDAGTKPAGGDKWKVEDLPPGAQKMIADLRKEAGTRRAEAADAKKAREQAEAKAKAGDERFATATEAFMRALGLTPEPDEPQKSPEELIGDLTTKYQQKSVELAVYRAATGHGADPDALLDSRGFTKKAFALDPSADGFDDAIAEAIGEAIEANPKLRAAAPEWEQWQQPAPSGGDFGGGPAGRTGPDEWSVDDFRRERQNRRGNP